MTDDQDRYRVHRPPFTMVPNTVWTDERLSWRAVGLLGGMLSRPPGWTFSHRRLCRPPGLAGGSSNREGREAVAAALRQLTRAGYYRAVPHRTPGGRIYTVTEVTYEPGVWPSEDDA